MLQLTQSTFLLRLNFFKNILTNKVISIKIHTDLSQSVYKEDTIMTMQKDPEERKKEIIETARRLFAEKGYQKTQVKDIVGEIGVAQGLFYYYFKSKEQVMEAVARDYADGVIDRISAMIRTDDNTIDKMLTILYVFIDTAKNETALFDQIQLAANGIIHDKVFDCIGNEMIRLVASIAKEGVEKGEMNCNDVETVTYILIKGLIGMLNDVEPSVKIQFLEGKMDSIKEIIMNMYGGQRGKR